MSEKKEGEKRKLLAERWQVKRVELTMCQGRWRD